MDIESIKEEVEIIKEAGETVTRQFKTGHGIMISFALLLIAYLMMPRYVQNALIYWFPEIDDYTIFCNRDVAADSPSAWEFHPQYNQSKIPQTLIDSVENYKTVAFVVIKDNKLYFEKYWNDYNHLSYSNSFSAAKTIVAFSILKAIELGHIKSLDQSVLDFIPELRIDTTHCLTIRHLLSMSSGLNWKESYSGLFNTTTEAYYGENLDAMVLGLTTENPPGKMFEYKSGDTQLLAIIVKRATGMTISEFVGNYLWTPMGAESDALWSLDQANGSEKAYCCFNSNARDFARWGQLMLDSGAWNGNQLIAKHLMKIALTPCSYIKDINNRAVDYYGLHLWITQYKGLTVNYMRGINGQYIFVIPQKKMIVVRLGEKRSKIKINEHPSDIYLYLKAAFEMVDNQQ